TSFVPPLTADQEQVSYPVSSHEVSRHLTTDRAVGPGDQDSAVSFSPGQARWTVGTRYTHQPGCVQDARAQGHLGFVSSQNCVPPIEHLLEGVGVDHVETVGKLHLCGTQQSEQGRMVKIGHGVPGYNSSCTSCEHDQRQTFGS